MDFRTNVLQVLERKGITQADLAKKLNKSRQNISILLKEGRKPSYSTIKDFADALEVDTQELITGTKNSEEEQLILNPAPIKRFFEFIFSMAGGAPEYKKMITLYGQLIKQAYTKNGPIDEKIINSIKSAYPNFNVEWFLSGTGKMLLNDDSISNPMLALPEHSKENELELIKTEDHTEFRRLGEDKYLVVSPLINHYSYDAYISGCLDPLYIDEMPKHAVVMNELSLGIYRSIEVRGDSMDNGLKGCYSDGDILTGRKILQRHWRNKLHLHKYKFYMFVTFDGIFIKEVLEHDIENGNILCHSLNPDKESYPDFELNLSEVKEMYYIKAVTEPYK